MQNLQKIGNLLVDLSEIRLVNPSGLVIFNDGSETSVSEDDVKALIAHFSCDDPPATAS